MSAFLTNLRRTRPKQKKPKPKNHPKKSSQHKTTPPQGFFLWIAQDGYITPHNYLQKKFLFVACFYTITPRFYFYKKFLFVAGIYNWLYCTPLILYMVRYYIVLGFVKFL